MEDLVLFALVFVPVLLAASAGLCASAVVTPTEASTNKERLQGR